MPTYKRISLFIATIILAPRLASAANFVVGKCIPKLQTFSTISAAVSSVPPGSTIYVCPGAYPEQVAILQPLTLQGVQVNNADRAVITVPLGPLGGSGLQVNVTSQATVPSFGFPAKVEAQVLVRTPGPVTISDITVDGTGASMGCVFNNPAGVWLAGIFYDTGSSGKVNRVTTRNQLDNNGPHSIGCGSGIWAEDSTDPGQTITIQNSDARDFDLSGIFVGTDLSQEQQFAPAIIGNDVYGGSGILSAYASSTISNNNVHRGDGGITAFNAQNGASSILSNTVSDSGAYGISASGTATVKHNKVSNVSVGITFGVNQAGIFAGNNTITNTGVAIELVCATGTVGGPGNENTISDARIGIDQAPPGFANLNHFHNVDTVVTGGCP
jgi:hypothetical protein